MLNNEQTQILEQAIFLLFKLRNDQSVEKWEEKRTQEFEKFIKSEHCEKTKKTLIEEIKEKMLIELKLKGSVRERDNGLIEFRSQQFGSVYGRDADEIKRKLQQKLNDLKNNKSNKNIYLSEFYEKFYLPYKINQNRAESSIRGIEYNFSYILEHGFDKRLNAYTPQNIEEFLFSIDKTRKRQIMQGLLNNMFNRAITLSMLKVNPCLPVEKMQHKQEQGTAFSFDELLRYLTFLLNYKKIGHSQKCYFLFVLLTGTRRNEALDMLYSESQFVTKILRINGTKTDGSLRDIPLFPLVEKLLSTLKPEANGKYFTLSERTVDDNFRNAMKGLGIRHKLHDLRHTFGTIQICVEKIDVKTVSLWLGHSTIETTLKIYTHPEQLDKATFLRGDYTDVEKLAILKSKYKKVIDVINAYLDNFTQNLPKNIN
ncbi:MAG: site-specific integrase [Clostridia bacterium]|nr:site-specific integrase [Clostridia bacterium]